MSEHPPSASGAATADLAGRMLAGRYLLSRLIAAGGMAQVWEADDQVLARPVAVKLLHPHLAADEAFVERFRHEAIAAARLSHPSIVSIYDTVSDQGLEAIVMELVRGVTLRARLDEVGTFDVADAVSAGAQVADALEVAHRALVVHRDIKPANILLNSDGRVMVADFGIAKALRAGDRTAEGLMLGTAKYLAPEQVEGAPVDGRTDLYSLGVVVYEALCGRPPFHEDNDAATALARLHRAPLRPRQIHASIPRAVEEVVLRAMAVSPDDRYATASELRAALLGSLHGRVPDTLPPPAPRLAAPTRAAPPRIGPAAAKGTAGSSTDSPPTGSQRPTVANIPAPLTASPPSALPPSSDNGFDHAATPSFGRSERSWILPTVLIVLIAVALGVAGVLLGKSQSSDKTLGPAVPSTPVKAVSATTYDPPPGDGSEGIDHGANVGRVIDGDVDTLWQTDKYHPPGATFAGLKDGVGVYVVVDHSSGLQQLVVQSPDSGWSATVYVADAAPANGSTPLAAWGKAVDSKTDIASGKTSFDLHGARGKVVLLWITRLPTNGQLGIAEMGVQA